MKFMERKPLAAGILSLGLIVAAPVFAVDTSLPAEPQTRSEAADSVQPQVEAKKTEQAAKKRQEVTAEAAAALDETRKALQLLEEDKPDEALAALESVTGKLELLLARAPDMALAPVDIEVDTVDILASLDTIKAVIHDAERYLNDGKIQQARPLVASLASEIVISTTNIPLATYPDAIKAVTPLIDEGKLDEAKADLQFALSTLVEVDEVIALPVLRAEQLLQNAENLAENDARTDTDNDILSAQLAEASKQLKMAELLGYGTEESFEPMHEELDAIKDRIAEGQGGEGWFDRIKEQLSDLL